MGHVQHFTCIISLNSSLPSYDVDICRYYHHHLPFIDQEIEVEKERLGNLSKFPVEKCWSSYLNPSLYRAYLLNLQGKGYTPHSLPLPTHGLCLPLITTYSLCPSAFAHAVLFMPRDCFLFTQTHIQQIHAHSHGPPGYQGSFKIHFLWNFPNPFRNSILFILPELVT